MFFELLLLLFFKSKIKKFTILENLCIFGFLFDLKTTKKNEERHRIVGLLDF